MKKVLIIYNNILHYRKAFFNELSKNYDVTVLHSGVPTVTNQDSYKETITKAYKLGPFVFQRGVLAETSKNEYDIVILLFDVRWVSSLLSFFQKKQKFILWGAWITQSSIANQLRVFFTKRAFANVFYTNEAKQDFLNLNINKKNLYVANNTFDVGTRIKSFECNDKFRILFVGSFDKRKQNDQLLNAFSNIKDLIPNEVVLTLIGGGREMASLERLAGKLNLGTRVQFVGVINDNNTLKNYYENSIASVSFGQAGLSVLQSMGYGVPFVTKVNAISGGEKSNIKNGYNSVFCEDNQESLEKVLILLCNDINYARKLGENAYHYYTKYCSIENMAQGFIDAIEGSNEAKIDERK